MLLIIRRCLRENDLTGRNSYRVRVRVRVTAVSGDHLVADDADSKDSELEYFPQEQEHWFV